MNRRHWRAGHWFGKDHADAYEIDPDEHGGVVAHSGRWFTEAWWDGHWFTRNRCGEWSHSRRSICTGRAGHDGEHDFYSPQDHRAYLESRHDEAERATRGNLVTEAGRRRGLTGDHFFSGRKVSSKYATEELREWLRQNGGSMSASAFRAQAGGGGGRRATYDDAGVPY